MSYSIALPGKPGKTAPSPYATTAMLVERLYSQNARAYGVIRHPDGRIERRAWGDSVKARYADCTHAFVITRDPATWATGLELPNAKALNPDQVTTGSSVGLYECRAGQLPA